MSKSVFCLVASNAQAVSIVDRLRSNGFTSSDVSVLLPDKSGAKDFAHKANTKAPEGATVGAGSGAVLGGVAGWLVGIGALTIPGAGPFLAAGPLMAALGGVAVGGAVGGITGALVGFGIPEFEAKRYEGKIREGNVLISVHTDNDDELKRAKQIFKDMGGESISTSTEAAVKGR